MQEVILRFNSTGFKDCHQVCIRIFDDNSKLIFQGKTYNGKIKLCLEKRKVYLLKAFLDFNQLIIPFYVTDYYYCFSFKNVDNHIITFKLTDYHYDNLPIMKGVLSFGKNS